jgi:hypothetical protein
MQPRAYHRSVFKKDVTGYLLSITGEQVSYGEYDERGYCDTVNPMSICTHELQSTSRYRVRPVASWTSLNRDLRRMEFNV